jgi:hypothetical protein
MLSLLDTAQNDALRHAYWLYVPLTSFLIATGCTMASSIVDELFDRLIHHFPANQSYRPSDFSTAPMPAPIAHFLEQLLQRRLDLEMRNMRDATSAWIDADHPAVLDAARVFRDALQPHLHIPQSEWEGVLRRAVQRITAYLIHPTQTMTNFVFGEQADERSVASVRERVRFFAAYSYLRDAADAYIEREEATVLRRTQFESMLQRVDEQTTAGFGADDWMTLMDPLFRLMELTRQPGVPVSFLQTFFQSKKATGIVRRLQTASLEQGTTILDRSDLRQLILGRTAPSDSASGDSTPEPASISEPSPSRPPRAEASPAPNQPAPSPPPSESPAPSNGPTPLWQQFRSAGGLSADASPTPSPVNNVSEAAPLWQRFRPAPSSTEEATAPSSPEEAAPSSAEDTGPPLLPLEQAVLGGRSPSNRDLFVRELFNGSQEDYRKTLQRLRKAPNWTRASQIIAQDVFRTHQVNIYSEPAVLFTNAVEDRFRQRS